ncbi:outer membrane beta-barrel protein [Mesorhizobium sp. ANAO-SY3R2]|uniref:outer membrane beta-barrel protein n=1 Tax=Mesorhizobium sp. ANAO-SY3R2 TaxID=3166644 RepID=UPI00366F3399
MLLATASAATLSCAAFLHAQEAGLRGTVTESAVSHLLLGQMLRERRAAEAEAAEAGSQNPPATYQPVSAGAVPDQPGNSSTLFSEPPGAESNFDTPAAPIRPATTARQRAEEARLRLMSPPGAAAARPANPVETDDIMTAVVRQGPVDSELQGGQGPESVRQGAIEARQRQPDENPFEAVGIRLGSFVLRSGLEQGIVATSNANSSANGQSAVLSETTVRLNAASDWETHSATINAYGGFRRTLSGQEVKDLAGGIDGALELEFADDLRATGGLAYTVSPESATSPVVIAGPAERATLQTIDAALGLEKDIGNLRLGLAGEATSEIYGNADLPGGATLSQKDRNSTLYAGTFRLGYELSPAITPFGEVEYGRRIYDQTFDTAGFERSSNVVGVRAGVELDMGEKFGGELSAGWMSENFDDDRLNTVSAATVAADLRWSPLRGTIVRLNGTTGVEGSTTPGESGSVLYAGRLGVERQMRADLTGLATVGLGWRDYPGTGDHELGLTAEAGLTWWLSRYAGLTGRLRHETMNSTLPGRDSTTNSIFLGVNVQR